MVGRATLAGVPVVLIAVGLAPPAAHASFPGTSGRIAYVSVAHNCPDVHTVAANGTGDRQLTNCPAEIADPAWNAAGNRIAVAMTTSGGANGPGPLDLYTMSAGGSGLVRVTNDSVEDADPYWSADGSTIVEGRVRDGGPATQNIATVPAAGGTPATLVTGSAGNEASEPQFSPDGSRIAFQQRTGPTDDVYVMSADGSNKVDVTTGTNHNNEYPAWSPDGKYLAFASDRNGVFEIFVVDVSGGASNGTVYPITTETSAADIQPTWSPDQTMIAFTHGCADDNCSGQSGTENGDIDAVAVTDLANPGTPHAVVATGLPEYSPDWGVACTSGCTAPPPSDVQRSLSLRLSGQLTAKGELADPTGKHPECATRQTVKVQRRGGGTWHTLKTVQTNSNGGYQASIPNRSGKYRALSPTVAVANLSCLKAVSAVRTRILKHKRTIPYFNLAASPDGSFMFANGKLRSTYAKCGSGKPVHIQKRSGSSWATIATSKAKGQGPDATTFFGNNIPIRNGDYRAKAPKVTLSSGDTCAAATSVTITWPLSG